MTGRFSVHGWWLRACGRSRARNVGTDCGRSSETEAVRERTAKSCECVSCVEHLPRECHRSIAAGAEAMEAFPGAVNIRVIVCPACAERMRGRFAARFLASGAAAAVIGAHPNTESSETHGKEWSA